MLKSSFLCDGLSGAHAGRLLKQSCLAKHQRQREGDKRPSHRTRLRPEPRRESFGNQVTSGSPWICSDGNCSNNRGTACCGCPTVIGSSPWADIPRHMNASSTLSRSIRETSGRLSTSWKIGRAHV